MKILSTFLKGKITDEQNEDRIVITPHYVGVVDGATSKSSFRKDGKTSGQWAADLVVEAIQSLPVVASMPMAVAIITQRILRFYEENLLWDEVKQYPERRLTASCVLYSCAQRQIWMIGDCQCRVGAQTFTNAKKIDSLLSEARSAFIEAELLKGISIHALQEEDTGRSFIRPFLVNQSVFQNTVAGSEYAFTVFDGFPVALEKVKVLSVPEGANVILASDGYPVLLDTLAATEAYLQEIIQKDPLCIRLYKSTKGVYKGQCSFDDRAFISFSV